VSCGNTAIYMNFASTIDVKRIGKASLCAPMDVSVEDNSFWKNRINNWFVFGLISSIYIAMIRLESVDSTRAH
jgi:hypothetical protein